MARRWLLVFACALWSALASAQSPVLVSFAWDVDPGDPGVAAEVERDGVSQPCGDWAEPTPTSRTCRALMPVGTATFRLRMSNTFGAGPWSSELAATIPQPGSSAPGPFTVQWHSPIALPAAEPDMAVAFDSASNLSGAGTSLSGSHTTSGANRAMLVFVAVDAGSNFNPSVSYSGVSMGAPVVELFTGRYGAYFVLANPALGANTLAVTGLPGGGQQHVIVLSFSDVDQTTPVDAAETESATAGSTPHSETVASAVGDLVVSFVVHNAAALPTVGGSASPAMTIPSGGSVTNAALCTAAAYQAGQASVTTEWGGLNGNRTIFALNVNAAAAAGGGRHAALCLVGCG